MPKFNANAILCSTKTVFTSNSCPLSGFLEKRLFETLALKSGKNQNIKNYCVFLETLNTVKSLTEAGVNNICSGWGNLPIRRNLINEA
ncbi:hypothetical protein MASR2M47_10610 [Draconibacterium sp.]